jgi:NADPH2:quinone reductase
VLELVEDAPVPEPAEHELLVRVSRAGVNYADTHARENSYLAPYELPLTPGAEVAGTTEDGRRVAAMIATGGYAEYAVVPKAAAFEIPDGCPTPRRWRSWSRA